ncbi:MAG: LysR substrate-binding domain-containing protein [Dongiaceae bacterium]
MSSTPRRLPPLTWLRAFEASARHVSFAAAADELGVTPSAVSQQVRLLEQHLGRLLFHRLPRGLRLAEAGQSYLPLLHAAFERVARGTEEIFGERSEKRLTLRSTVSFASYWLLPRLARFRATHPELNLRLTSSIWSAEYPDPGIDLEVRLGTGDWPGLRAERLTWDRVYPVCSPGTASAPPHLKQPADIARHKLLHIIGFREGWPQWLKAANADRAVDTGRGLECDTTLIAMELAMQGEGIAMGRSCFADRLIETGRLVAPFPLELPSEEAFYLASPVDRPDTEPVRVFRNWITEETESENSSAASKRPRRNPVQGTAPKRPTRR